MKSRFDGDGKAFRVHSVPHLADQDDGYAGFDTLSAATGFAQDLWSTGGMNSVTVGQRSRVAGRTIWEAVMSLPGA